jgi:hypothetical protein
MQTHEELLAQRAMSTRPWESASALGKLLEQLKQWYASRAMRTTAPLCSHHWTHHWTACCAVLLSLPLKEVLLGRTLHTQRLKVVLLPHEHVSSRR